MGAAAVGAEAVGIGQARTAADLAAAAALFRAYAASLPVDLGYQGFEAEVASLPGRYAAPAGALLLARAAGEAAGEVVGCVAVRPLGGGVCEMKRLYVAPAAQGRGLGRALAAAAIAAAERAGHRQMRLDTLPSMATALGLYRALGFAPVAPYYATPVAGTIFLAKSLGGRG